MTQLLVVEDGRRNEILADAAERLTQVTLSHRVDGGWVTHKSRLMQADGTDQFLILEQPLCTGEQAPPELSPGEIIGLTFRRGHKKCMCCVQIDHLLNYSWEGLSVPALQVTWPESLQEMQRRVYYRCRVPKGRRIEAQMWDGGTMGRDPAALCDAPHHVGLLTDLSAGGCRIQVEVSRDPQLQPGDTVGIQIQVDPRSGPLLLDAVFRHAERPTNGKMALGFQFVGMELTPQGRQKLQLLSRIVSTFFRIEARRKNRRLQNHPRRRK